MGKIKEEKTDREEQRAKAWAHYVKVRDAETAKYTAIEKTHSRTANGYGDDSFDEGDIYKRIKKEVDERYKKEIAAAEAKKQATMDRAKKILDDARAKKNAAIDAAWQAFEILDVGGKTKRS